MIDICEMKALGGGAFLMRLAAPEIAKRAKAGQYLILMAGETSERVPLTIADWDGKAGAVTVLFRVEGASTRRLAAKKAGETLPHVMGPLGMPTDAGDAKRVLIAASGMGCTAAHAHLKALLAGGAQVAVVVSEEENDAPVLLEEMKDLAPVETAAGDGTYRPVCGAVLEKLGGVDLVLAFGPAQMVKAVADATRETGVRMIAGLRPLVIDGTGMCGGCRVRVNGKYRYACIDGPQFDGHAVDFDELIGRGGFYRRQEEEQDAHLCRLGIGRD